MSRGEYLAPTDPRDSTTVTPYVDLRDADTPWGDEARAMEKSLILKTAVLHPDRTDLGVPFHAVLDEVFGENWTTNGPNYGRAWRFVRRYPDFFDTRKPSGDFLWIRPTERAVSLIQRIQSLGTPDCDGVAPGSDPNRLPKERTAAVLRSARTIRTDRQRALLLRQMAQEKERMLDADGERKTLDLDGGRGKREAATNFTHPGRAARVQARHETIADALTAEYDVASWVTYTLPRECVPSVYDSAAVVREGLTRLHRDRFGYSRQDRPRPGYVPDYMAVLEPQEKLVAHLHVVYGGEERVMTESNLREDWADLLDAPAGKPPQVDVRTLSLDRVGWSVTAVDGEEVDPYDGIREYHRAGVQSLATLASMAPDDLHGLAADLENGLRVDVGRDLAGLALLFATGMWFTTYSNGLR